MPELNIKREEIEDALHSFCHIAMDIDEREGQGWTLSGDVERVDALLQKVYDHVQGKTT